MLAALGRRIFVGHGERTGELLSLDEAYFTFSPQEPPSPLAGALRASLEAHADAQGWAVAPAESVPTWHEPRVAPQRR